MGIISKIWNWLAGRKSEENTGNDREGHAPVYLPEDGPRRQPRRQGRPELQKNIEKKKHNDRHGQSDSAGDKKGQKQNGRQQTSGNARAAKHKGGRNVEENRHEELNKKTADRRPRNMDMTGWEPPALQKENAEDVLFQDLPLDNRILRALLEELGFKKCSPIQAKALPVSLTGKDLAGKAQTGTGKTAAFLITILQRFLKGEQSAREPWQPMGIILAPTRELAVQIYRDAVAIGAYCRDFRVTAVFGGMDFDKQMSQIAGGVDLVVATPGRLLDFIGRGAIDMSKIEIAVIDEADRMLDMGFIPDVKRIMGSLPPAAKRQTMLFSATLTHDIMELASRWMGQKPEVVEIEPERVVAEGIDETVYALTTTEKMSVLLWILTNEDCRRVIIFRNRRHDVETLHSALTRCGIQCEMLTGDVDQKKRLRILDDFRDSKIKIIVATDVAGRGIHVDDVTHVINYDFPYEAEDYVHRVGRTARAGHKGRAISFADEDSAFVIPDIEKYIERPLPISQPDDAMLNFGGKYKGLTSTRSSGARSMPSGGYGGYGKTSRHYGRTGKRGH